MKKRLEKKLHSGEYAEKGISIKIIATEETAADILDQLAGIADRNGLMLCGGGIGNIILPTAEYGDLTIPTKVERLLLALSDNPYLLTDCVLGYMIAPKDNTMPDDTIGIIKDALCEHFDGLYAANFNVDLWN